MHFSYLAIHTRYTTVNFPDPARHNTTRLAVMWRLETMSRLETVSRPDFNVLVLVSVSRVKVLVLVSVLSVEVLVLVSVLKMQCLEKKQDIGFSIRRKNPLCWARISQSRLVNLAQHQGFLLQFSFSFFVMFPLSMRIKLCKTVNLKLIISWKSSWSTY